MVMRSLVLVLLLFSSEVSAQSLRIELASREIYAEIPFILAVTAEGFDEEPQPEAPGIAITGCRVTYLGASPNVSSMVQIINGRRSESRDVRFVYRYRVEAPRAGTFTVPKLMVTQGTKTAESPPGRFEVKEVASSRDMQIRLNLPKRPLWVGETVPITLDWFLRKDPDNPNLVVPLFDSVAQVQVAAPPVDGRRTLAFPAGARELALPYDQKKTTLNGVAYTRFRFTALVTPHEAGTIELPPSRVAARLAVGHGRDMFGFRVAQHKLFKAQDVPRQLEVRPLPQKDRPPSFENAVGRSYSIAVRASRTVVRVGEPIELEITVRGLGNLAGLSLPSLYNAGLSRDLFTVADEATTGQILEDNKSKRFRVTVRLKSAKARGIPPLSFSYFDPNDAKFHTVKSEPVALSVGGSAVVRADDVVSTAPEPERPTDAKKTHTPVGISLVGADLSLSAPDQTMRSALSAGDIRLPLCLLYGIPLILFIGQIWRVRTSAQRGADRFVREAHRVVTEAVGSAKRSPAKEGAPRLVSALKAFARQVNEKVPTDTVERIENAAFDPSAAEKPLASDLSEEVQQIADGWLAEHREKPKNKAAALTTMLLAFFVIPAHAGEELVQAQQQYRDALEEPDRTKRTRAFRQAEASYRQLAEKKPDRPELLTDWGNAALGGQDIGRATLAYRRALQLDGSVERARRNLSWVRSRAASWLPRPEAKGAMDALFFWHHTLSIPERHLVGALSFCLFILLITPFATRRRKMLRRLGLVPLIIFLAATVSITLDDGGTQDAVVVEDGAYLRSADSLGAPTAFANPLPAGAEVRMLETRGTWSRITLADGTRGWMRSHTLEPIVK